MIESIEFNGYTFQDAATLQSITGIGLPEINTGSQDKPNQDGAVPTNFTYGARIFGWKGHVSSTTPTLYLAERQQVAYALDPTNYAGDEMTFNLVTGATRTLRKVVVTQGPMDMPEDEPSRTWNTYIVALRADFPFFEGTSKSNTQGVTAIETGVVIPAPIPAPLTSTSGGTNKATLNNAGNAPAYPTLTILGPGQNFIITNETTGQVLEIEYTLSAGETIILDCLEKTALQDDTNIRANVDGDWIFLKGGAAGQDNVISFVAEADSNSDTSLTVDYKDTYLNI